MSKLVQLVLLASGAATAIVAPAAAQIGGVGWSPKPLKFHVQSPTNVPQSERYWITNGYYHMVVYSNDGAFSVGNTTAPRTEQRFDPDYTNGIIQYQAAMMTDTNSSSVCLFQIHTGDAQSPQFGSTTFMLFWFSDHNGSVHDYSGATLATNLSGKWFQLNVDHNLNSGIITVWVNGTDVWQQADNGAGDFYFKDGVYEQPRHGPTYKMENNVSNIWIWTNLTAAVFSGFYEIKNANSLLAATVRGGATKGAAIVQSNFTAGASALWYLVPTDGGYYRVMNVASGLALAMQNSATADGAPVVQQPYVAGGAADWLPGRNATNVNTYTFTNRLSGKVLEVPGGSKLQNVQLDQGTFTGGANQKWLLIPCGNVTSNSVFAASLASLLTNGNQIQLQLSGVPGARYVVQAATNLTAPDWHPLFTNVADPFGHCAFTDVEAAASPGRFYRTVLQ
ncbi:MAG TPA: RICIN domain-containing protein [Verrucomicrobiae bacterium]|nr:RICIN domain-containing protein [Verrucomicrobiae bacterium]